MTVFVFLYEYMCIYMYVYTVPCQLSYVVVARTLITCPRAMKLDMDMCLGKGTLYTENCRSSVIHTLATRRLLVNTQKVQFLLNC